MMYFLRNAWHFTSLQLSVRDALGIKEIKFKSVAKTAVKKVLKRIIAEICPRMDEKTSRAIQERVVELAQGDIRQAISELEVVCLYQVLKREYD